MLWRTAALAEVDAVGFNFVSGLNGTVLRTPFHIFGVLKINAKNFDARLEASCEKERSGISGFLIRPVLSREAAPCTDGLHRMTPFKRGSLMARIPREIRGMT